MDNYLLSNQALWDEWADINAGSKIYDLEGFKAGRNSLKPLERARWATCRARACCTSNATSDSTACRGPAWGAGDRGGLFAAGGAPGALAERRAERSGPLPVQRPVRPARAARRAVRRGVHLVRRAHVAARPGALGADRGALP